MSKYNELVDTLLEAAAPPAVPPTTGAPPVPPTGTPPTGTPPTGTVDIETEATLKAYQDLMEFFSDPELIKILQDAKMDSKRKVGALSNRMKKWQNDPNKSNLENAINSTIQQWTKGSTLKRAQMAMGGASKVGNILKKTFLPTHSGSTGVFS